MAKQLYTFACIAAFAATGLTLFTPEEVRLTDEYINTISDIRRNVSAIGEIVASRGYIEGNSQIWLKLNAMALADIVVEADNQANAANSTEFATKFTWYSIAQKARAVNKTIGYVELIPEISQKFGLQSNNFPNETVKVKLNKVLQEFAPLFVGHIPTKIVNDTETAVNAGLVRIIYNQDKQREAIKQLTELNRMGRLASAKLQLIFLEASKLAIEQRQLFPIELQYLLLSIINSGRDLHYLTEPYVVKLREYYDYHP